MKTRTLNKHRNQYFNGVHYNKKAKPEYEQGIKVSLLGLRPIADTGKLYMVYVCRNHDCSIKMHVKLLKKANRKQFDNDENTPFELQSYYPHIYV